MKKKWIDIQNTLIKQGFSKLRKVFAYVEKNNLVDYYFGISLSRLIIQKEPMNKKADCITVETSNDSGNKFFIDKTFTKDYMVRYYKAENYAEPVLSRECDEDELESTLKLLLKKIEIKAKKA